MSCGVLILGVDGPKTAIELGQTERMQAEADELQRLLREMEAAAQARARQDQRDKEASRARATAETSPSEPPSILKAIFHDTSGNDALLAAWFASSFRAINKSTGVA